MRCTLRDLRQSTCRAVLLRVENATIFIEALEFQWVKGLKTYGWLDLSPSSETNSFTSDQSPVFDTYAKPKTKDDTSC